MVGILLSYWVSAYFQGRTVSFRVDICYLLYMNSCRLNSTNLCVWLCSFCMILKKIYIYIIKWIWTPNKHKQQIVLIQKRCGEKSRKCVMQWQCLIPRVDDPTKNAAFGRWFSLSIKKGGLFRFQRVDSSGSKGCSKTKSVDICSTYGNSSHLSWGLPLDHDAWSPNICCFTAFFGISARNIYI